MRGSGRREGARAPPSRCAPPSAAPTSACQSTALPVSGARPRLVSCPGRRAPRGSGTYSVTPLRARERAGEAARRADEASRVFPGGGMPIPLHCSASEGWDRGVLQSGGSEETPSKVTRIGIALGKDAFHVRAAVRTDAGCSAARRLGSAAETSVIRTAANRPVGAVSQSRRTVVPIGREGISRLLRPAERALAGPFRARTPGRGPPPEMSSQLPKVEELQPDPIGLSLNAYERRRERLPERAGLRLASRG